MSAYAPKQVHSCFFPRSVCSVEQEPTPELSNCVPVTDDLLALSDGFVKNPFSPFVQLSNTPEILQTSATRWHWWTSNNLPPPLPQMACSCSEISSES